MVGQLQSDCGYWGSWTLLTLIEAKHRMYVKQVQQVENEFKKKT